MVLMAKGVITKPELTGEPSEWDVKAAKYADLRGVDFSADPSMVSQQRSPYCPNIISPEFSNIPESGCLQKRTGWRVLFHNVNPDCVNNRVNGLFSAELSGEKIYVAHVGDRLYTFTDDFSYENGVDSVITEIVSEDGGAFAVNNAPSSGFVMEESVKTLNEGKSAPGLYILTGGEYVLFRGEKYAPEETAYFARRVKDCAYIPTVTISRLYSGGGTSHEAVNLLTPYREENFLGDSSHKTFKLSHENIDIAPVTVEILDESGEQVKLTESTDYTVDFVKGEITFTEVHAPVVVGQDNIFVTYAKTFDVFDEKNPADIVEKCTIAALYGAGGDNRVFLSGNAELPAYDWYSGIFRPSYIPDLSYSLVGNNDTAVLGYLKIGQYLAVIKEEDNTGFEPTTIFLRDGLPAGQAGLPADLEFSDWDNAVFRTLPAVAGVGAVSPRSFAVLGDEPLFLAKTGVYALTYGINPAGDYAGERTVRNRSVFVNSKLTRENDLKNAVSIEYGKYYIICINQRCYILDGRRKSGVKNDDSSDFVYECFHWDNIPAVCFMKSSGFKETFDSMGELRRYEVENLYFGTSDGKICKFNIDREQMDQFSDGGMLQYEEIGTSETEKTPFQYRIKANPEFANLYKSIVSEWDTPNDGDGYVFESLSRRGTLATFQPMTRSSANIWLEPDGEPEFYAREDNIDVFDFLDIDFERFTFSSNTSPHDVWFRRKVKRYKRLKIRLRNAELNEGFGVHGIIKIYKSANFSRERRV
jgi:hypothetical protein